MNGVNNCLTMSNSIDAQEIALERLKNVLIIFEKKKRNLDKRKNKLDEYKKKKDLNEDQQVAVSKYQEVVSNLELVDELNMLAVQQIKDAEKMLKKVKKQEKLESKRHEASLIEFVMKTYYVLERIFNNTKLQNKLITENYIEATELDLLRDLYNETHMGDKCNWKKCSEHLQSLYEGGNKPLDIIVSEDSLLKNISKDEMIKSLEKTFNIDWLSSNNWEEHLEMEVEHDLPEIGINQEEEITKSESLHEESIELSNLPQKEPEQKPVEKHSVQTENTKLSFVFLHESVVQDDVCSKSNENGYDSSGFIDEHVPRSNSQMSAKSIGNSNPNNAWHNAESGNAVDDVFSSATQSEFMHSDNSRNLKIRGQRQPNNGRYKTRGNSQAGSFPNRDAPHDANNYWKSTSRGGAFNSNTRFPRTNRGRGRGRGNGRTDGSRQTNEE